MGKKYFDLTVFCHGSTPIFLVNEETMAHFEDAFEAGTATITFSDAKDAGVVTLRNNQLTGFKKASTIEKPFEK